METPGENPLSMTRRSDATVDEHIARMANSPMSEVVSFSEGGRGMIGTLRSTNAAEFLVSRLFTDAVFNQDIRSIQLIINRIDGGLPKDTEVDLYKTQFGDCLEEIMKMPDGEQLKVKPEDTVMLALCKSLYSIATEDLYWDMEHDRKRRPTDAQKRDRDAAMRMVLERTGGRKTLSSVAEERHEDVEVAPWIAQLQSGNT